MIFDTRVFLWESNRRALNHMFTLVNYGCRCTTHKPPVSTAWVDLNAGKGQLSRSIKVKGGTDVGGRAWVYRRSRHPGRRKLPLVAATSQNRLIYCTDISCTIDVWRQTAVVAGESVKRSSESRCPARTDCHQHSAVDMSITTVVGVADRTRIRDYAHVNHGRHLHYSYLNG